MLDRATGSKNPQQMSKVNPQTENKMIEEMKERAEGE